MRGFGRVFKRAGSAHWWISYCVRGKEHRESSHSTERTKAEKLLKKKIGEISSGRFVAPSQERVMFSELLDGLVADYKNNDRGSLYTTKCHLKPVRAAFDRDRAIDVTEARIEQYKADRLAAGYAPATVNRELAAMKRAFNLALQQRRIPSKPFIEMLKENNVRQGFFEESEFRAVYAHLPDYLQPAMLFKFLTGWRKGDIFPKQVKDATGEPALVGGLRWSQVNFDRGVVRLEPGTTKNDEGREFPFALLPELEELLHKQRELTDKLEREQNRVIPWVFHRNGKPIQDYGKAWLSACKAAGVSGRVPHDFRRTAVASLERAGVSRSVGMKLTGHKTESVYRRYAIAPKADLEEGVEKLAAMRQSRAKRKGSKVVPIRKADRA